jgi:hypothetical protein
MYLNIPFLGDVHYQEKVEFTRERALNTTLLVLR